MGKPPIGLIPIALALILGVRRIWVEHYLLLDNDSMVLPIGLFQMRTARIEYTSIRSIWRRYGPYWGTLVLGLRPERQTFKVVPDFFPDNESYEALEQFLKSKGSLKNTGAKKTSRNPVSKIARRGKVLNFSGCNPTLGDWFAPPDANRKSVVFQ